MQTRHQAHKLTRGVRAGERAAPQTWQHDIDHESAELHAYWLSRSQTEDGEPRCVEDHEARRSAEDHACPRSEVELAEICTAQRLDVLAFNQFVAAFAKRCAPAFAGVTEHRADILCDPTLPAAERMGA